MLILVGLGLVALYGIPLVIDTGVGIATEGRLNHNIRDVTLAVVTIVGVPALLFHFFRPRRPPAASDRSADDELEERRAWLADLRDQGAPWHERSAR